MPKATITLPNGAVVMVEGSNEDIKKLLDYYGLDIQGKALCKGAKKTPVEVKAATATEGAQVDESRVDYAKIVNLIKNCDEAAAIETHILNQASQVNRTLLPLYVVHEYLGNSVSLTSGDINKITLDLGVPILRVNASRAFAGTASRYVIGDKVRKKGQPVRYKLSRRGLLYLKSVISGAQDVNQE